MTRPVLRDRNVVFGVLGDSPGPSQALAGHLERSPGSGSRPLASGEHPEVVDFFFITSAHERTGDVGRLGERTARLGERPTAYSRKVRGA